MAMYKQKCGYCNKNYVLAGRSQKFVVCFDCQKKELAGEVTDPVMKEMFDIPEEFYKTSGFLRNIKVSYLKFGNLTERQIEAFKKVVSEMKDKEKGKGKDGKEKGSED